ncbi:MAG TPA: acyl-CoA dehydrogenase family protein, partial [Acidimicrobiales bacterium]|nr:acyl-CoA dehydrogenase family protein [Acidimicrobiales bacterium]
MDLRETKEELTFRRDFRQWLEETLPGVQSAQEPPLASSEEQIYAERRRFDRALHRGGWSGITWKREYGGRGGSLTEQMIFAEECARAAAPEVFNRGGLGVMGPTVADCGTEEQRRRFLPAILASDEIWCQGFSEPDAGSDLAGLKTWAEAVEGGWSVRGQKIWTTLGHYADFCMLLARTSREAKKHHGLTMFIVPMQQPGVVVRPIRQIAGDQEFCEVFFDGAFVPTENLIGQVGDGWSVAMVTLGHERSTHFIGRQVRLGQEVTALVELVRL